MMREGWYRDPKIGAALAGVAAIVQVAAAVQSGRPAWESVLLTLVAAALAAWTWFALIGLAWLWRRPDRDEVLQALTLQRSQHAFNAAAWQRFERDAAMLRMLMAERALEPIEDRLAQHAHQVERYDRVAEALPAWSLEAARWYDTAAQAHSALPNATPAPSQTALDEAESMLPFGRQLSEEDRRATLHYLVVRKRLYADRAAIQKERSGALRKLAGEMPLPPAP